MSIIMKNSLREIWPEGGASDYSFLDDVKNKHGVYIFQNENGQVLYVGEARKQDIKTRVTQNFSEKDSGGTFRKNYMSNESLSFDEFIKAMKSARLTLITSEQSDMLIRALESLLILILKPKYNKDT